MVHNKASYESSLANSYLEQINFPSGGDKGHKQLQLNYISPDSYV